MLKILIHSPLLKYNIHYYPYPELFLKNKNFNDWITSFLLKCFVYDIVINFNISSSNDASSPAPVFSMEFPILLELFIIFIFFFLIFIVSPFSSKFWKTLQGLFLFHWFFFFPTECLFSDFELSSSTIILLWALFVETVWYFEIISCVV